jgi:thiamine biosynthesis lipoprotein
MTDGAFDITVGPIVKLWGFGPNFNKNIIPYEYDVNRTLQSVGTEKLFYKDGKIKKSNPAIEIDFSAIAKGGGVDIVSNYLITKNIDRFMVEIGGELTVSGYNMNNQKWRIGIRKPEKYDLDVTEKIEITNISIATSGTYENYFIKDGIKYSHIIDPVSGKPIKHDLVSVTVLAENASTADAIATALMVFGYDRALEWVNSTHQIECLLISKLSTGEYKMGISKDFPIN